MGWDISNILINLKKKIGLVEDRTTQVETGLSTLSGVVAAEGSYGNEVLVGKWGDSDLYRKVIEIGSVTDGASKAVESGLTNVTIREFNIISNYSNFCRVLPWVTVSEGNVQYTNAIYNYSNNSVIVASVGQTLANCFVTLYYTKNPPTRDGDNTESEPESETKK